MRLPVMLFVTLLVVGWCLRRVTSPPDGPEVSEDPQLSNAPTVIETPRPQPTDAEIEQAIAESQDYAAHKSAFLAGARALVRDGTCTVQQLRDYGGWVKSTTTSRMSRSTSRTVGVHTWTAGTT